MGKLVGWRRGLRQWWPVLAQPERYPPGVVGGQCPPYAPVRAVRGGYSCVEQPPEVLRDWHGAMQQRARAQALIGRPFTLFGPEPLSGLGQEPAEGAVAMTAGELATTMVLRGAVGTLIGAAAAPEGREGIWGAAGFVMGATLGELGIVGVALAALWRKAG